MNRALYSSLGLWYLVDDNTQKKHYLNMSLLLSSFHHGPILLLATFFLSHCDSMVTLNHEQKTNQVALPSEPVTEKGKGCGIQLHNTH